MDLINLNYKNVNGFWEVHYKMKDKVISKSSSVYYLQK